MNFNFFNCKSIAKFDGNKWIPKSKNEQKSIYIMNDDREKIEFISDNLFSDTVTLIVSRTWFQRIMSTINKNPSARELMRFNSFPQNSFETNLNKFFNEFSEHKNIGKGAYGRVYSAKNNFDMSKYAIKEIRIKKKNSETSKLMNEVILLAALNHQNIVRYHTSWIENKSDEEENETFNYDTIENGFTSLSDSNSSYSRSQSMDSPCCNVIDVTKKTVESVIYIQMELCQFNLKDWLENRNKDIDNEIQLSEPCRNDVRSMARQLLRGIEYIHYNNIIHRDIKPANIFLIQRNTNQIQLKIGDFGLARQFNVTDVLDEINLSSYIGTALYRAPEVSNNDEHVSYDEKCDLFSVGAVLLEMMLHFKTTSEIVNARSQYLEESIMYSRLNKEWPEEAVTVMQLLSKNPQNRPNASEIVHNSDMFRKYPDTLWKQNQELRKENQKLKDELAKFIGRGS